MDGEIGRAKMRLSIGRHVLILTGAVVQVWQRICNI